MFCLLSPLALVIVAFSDQNTDLERLLLYFDFVIMRAMIKCFLSLIVVAKIKKSVFQHVDI
jgi:hypothetical protein